MEKLSSAQIAKMIDHALLKPQMNRNEVEVGCKVALKYNTASVCVKPNDVAFCAKIMQGSDVGVGTVISFPHGNSKTNVKLLETETAIKDGAVEIDMVMPIGLVRSGEFAYVQKEVDAMLNLCHKNNALLKVIFENCYLSEGEIILCCEICSDVGVDYVKTSTGFGTYGARVEDLKLMRKYTAPYIKIKASGGIRTLDSFLENYEAGADRQGASSTEAIVEEAIKRGL